MSFFPCIIWSWGPPISGTNQRPQRLALMSCGGGGGGCSADWNYTAGSDRKTGRRPGSVCWRDRVEKSQHLHGSSQRINIGIGQAGFTDSVNTRQEQPSRRDALTCCISLRKLAKVLLWSLFWRFSKENFEEFNILKSSQTTEDPSRRWRLRSVCPDPSGGSSLSPSDLWPW